MGAMSSYRVLTSGASDDWQVYTPSTNTLYSNLNGGRATDRKSVV